MAAMPQVAKLAHVKAAAPTPAAAFAGSVRKAWHGGKIVSNKAEALRKFLERKQRAGDVASLAQIRATQSRLGISLEDEGEASAGGKKLRATHRPRAKVQEGGAHGTIVVNGRVVGPRVAAKQPESKQQKPRPAHAVVRAAGAGKRGGRSGKKAADKPPAGRIALETQLDLPLDALLKRKGGGGARR